jgi:hypothetical protein
MMIDLTYIGLQGYTLLWCGASSERPFFEGVLGVYALAAGHLAGIYQLTYLCWDDSAVLHVSLP